MQHWIDKFRNAIRGIQLGIHGQSSFAVHLPVAIAVLGAAWWLRCPVWQWCVLVLCIACVVTLELMNSALESLAKGLCQQHNEEVGKALDIASGAVLVGSLLAAVLGLVVLGSRLIEVFGNR